FRFAVMKNENWSDHFFNEERPPIEDDDELPCDDYTPFSIGDLVIPKLEGVWSSKLNEQTSGFSPLEVRAVRTRRNDSSMISLKGFKDEFDSCFFERT
ncbi:MAG: hypothetical protein NUV54_02315, partial [Candidatus Taylorbacteria bacterium]|nr:hypothetical protein [Candidatus Taylorbacteria bacterium]